MHDCLAKDQFIDALKDREIRMKIRESASKTLDEAVVEPCRSRQCTRLCWRSKGRLLRSRGEEQICRTPEAKHGCHKPDGSVCVETAQPPTSNENERKQNGRGLGPNTKDHIERPLHC